MTIYTVTEYEGSVEDVVSPSCDLKPQPGDLIRWPDGAYGMVVDVV